MMRDGLIERFALEICKSRCADDRPTKQRACSYCRAEAKYLASLFWPLVVEFVAEWLADQDGEATGLAGMFLHDDAASWGGLFADEWREEMGVPVSDETANAAESR